jgi:hypothetical protein
MAFVFGNRGELVNLDHVIRICPIRSNIPGEDFSLLVAGRADPIHAPATITDTIVQIIPAGDQWETLVLIEGDTPSYVTDPVIAWGLTLDGCVVAITADCPEGIHKQANADGLRRRGEPTVHLPFDATYPDADAWLSDIAAARKRVAATKSPRH